MSGLYGNVAGGFGYPKTFVLTDSDGNDIATGVVVGEETVFDATRDDVKAGKIFASNDGIQEGIDTRTYRTTHAAWFVLPGEQFSIPLEDYEKYNYTKFQAMIAELNTTQLDSTSVVKISLNDAVYDVNSTTKISDVTKNSSTKSVDLNITNDTNNIYVIHYNTYKEE